MSPEHASISQPAAEPETPSTGIELTILMPCLDEAETLASCIRKAQGFLRRANISGEVLIADNGSDDGSRDIAEAEGARCVKIARKGYGAALLGGIGAAKGRYVIMGDADDSYDFEHLDAFVDALRAGDDLVVGNRFRGGIETGAMPPLHRYLGNPVLSFLGRLLFQIRIGDIFCGLRGFDRERIAALGLRTSGMEFAEEMIVRSALANYRLAEVPTTLRQDGRSRRPHLRTWRDGWRSLRFLLLYSPRWLFLIPGLVLIVFGALGSAILMPGPVAIRGVTFDIHTFVVFCISILLGTQTITFALIARRYATRAGLLPASKRYGRFLESLSLEKLLVIALGFVLVGIVGMIWALMSWAGTDFGTITYPRVLRMVVLSLTVLAIGTQLAFAALLSSVFDIGIDAGPNRGDQL